MRKSLHKNPAEYLEELTDSSVGARSLEVSGHKFWVLNSASHIEQVLLNPAVYAKFPLPSSLRWMAGDGTSLSDYGNGWNTWNRLRPTKRRSLAPHLSALPEELLTALWRNDVSALPLVVDACNLCYRAFFRVSWQELFKCETDDAIGRAVDGLRETATAASWAASSRFYSSYSDRHLLLTEEGRWSKKGKYSDHLLKRQAAFEFLLNRAEESSDADSVVSDLREWINLQDLSPIASERFLRFAVVGTLLASFENSAATAAWLLWLLAGHPQWQERIASGDERALEWCLNETLRLYPPVWSLVRQTSASSPIGEHTIDAGAFVWMSSWVQGRQRAFWEGAAEFLPQRWENTIVPSGQFFPFGAGSRACPGESSARSQLAAWIRFLLRSYRFSRVEEALPPRPFFGVTQRPEAEVWLKFTPLSGVG